ncbi:MAG TPA: helix-turn-helix transcriptional regulator, partial [Ktedonobacterales bacterium]|nr:helix-turn-helix transcriptional regulator [Ktedonobacterales bacterium]
MSREQRGSSSDVQRHLAEKIRGRREELGLTQAELAARAGFSAPQIVSSIERNEREVKAVELAAIARALHCDLMDLFTSDNDREEAPVVAW